MRAKPILFALCGVALAALPFWWLTYRDSFALEHKDSFVVTRVVDGDTFHIETPLGDDIVRPIGINAPEIAHGGTTAECYGDQARTRARQLLEGRRVTLVADPTQRNRDRYGRLLRYVALPGGASFQEQMLREGMAVEYIVGRAYARRSVFLADQEAAKDAHRGLWSACPHP